jgi:hypothetical protein
LSKNDPEQNTTRLFTPRGIKPGKSFLQVVGVTGVEPVTLRLSSACSNQLSYTPVSGPIPKITSKPAFETGVALLVELRRVELLTYSLQSYRSTN